THHQVVCTFQADSGQFLIMAPRIFPIVKFLVKGGLAGGGIYVVYSQGLLNGATRGPEPSEKPKKCSPPAVEERAKYFGWKLLAVPKTEFSLCSYWNSEVQRTIGALSVTPTRACEYTQNGWKYMKELVK
uniref:MICOS complex subunit MIC13 n=1 Tax=Podarcis muralis TaxID=64176 RepID=A0A670IBH0_PODMU